MRNAGKYSKFVVMLLAALVMLLHSTVPHHHHLDNSSDHNTTASTFHGESSNEAVKHCHALNNIVFKKAGSTIDSNNAFYTVLFVISLLGIVKLQDETLLQVFSIKDIVILKQYLPSQLSFRGPPALV